MRVILQIEVFCWGASAAAAASSRCCLDCFGPSVPRPDRQTDQTQPRQTGGAEDSTNDLPSLVW